jgi:hypothetical protein
VGGICASVYGVALRLLTLEAVNLLVSFLHCVFISGRESALDRVMME